MFWNYTFKEDLQAKIWDYNKRNEYFTLNSLLNYAKEELEYKGSRDTLWRIIKSMGYKYKILNSRKILCEQNHIVTKKINFLRKYLQYKNSEEEINFIYLDETWIFQNGSSRQRWIHDSCSNLPVIKNEGKRYTILHAGWNGGFLDRCDLLLDSNNNDRDYHKTMNNRSF
jgi:hypothetical protein